RSQRKREIIEAIVGCPLGASPRRRTSVVSHLQPVEQPGNKADADFEKAEFEGGEAVEHTAKNQSRDRRKNLEWEPQADVQIEAGEAVDADQRSAVDTVDR